MSEVSADETEADDDTTVYTGAEVTLHAFVEFYPKGDAQTDQYELIEDRLIATLQRHGVVQVEHVSVDFTADSD